MDTVLAANPRSFTASALEQLVSGLDPERRYDILDLGPSVARNILFFQPHVRCYYQEDLLSLLQQQPGSELDSDTLNQYFSFQDAQYDMVLAWDLFNYLSMSAITNLGAYLHAHLRPGAQLHAILYPHGLMPEQPSIFQISAKNLVNIQCATNEQIVAPGYGYKTLREILPNFERQRSFLLQAGFSEELYLHK